MMYEKVSLMGEFTQLVPLCMRHKDGLVEAIKDGELWKLFVTFIPHVEDIDSFITTAENAYQSGDGLTFAIIDKSSGKVAGSTRFKNTCQNNKRVEIGYSFLGKSFQRTAINTEMRLLMLTHAFDHLDFNRVGFFVDYFNQTSRNAILRLGAKEEGVLRNHMIMPDGRVRDSVIYSIIKHEWPGVKQNLEFKLKQEG